MDSDDCFGIPSVDIRIVAEHIARWINTRAAIADPSRFRRRNAIVNRQWGIVGPLNYDGHLRRRICTGCVFDGISKDIAKRIAARTQGLDSRRTIIHHVRQRTIGCDDNRPVVPSNRGSYRARSGCLRSRHHPGHCFGIACIDIGVVGKHVANGIATCGPIKDASSFDGDPCFGNRSRIVVGTVDGERHLGSRLIIQRILDGVSKNVSRMVTGYAKCLHCSIAIVNRVGIAAI